MTHLYCGFMIATCTSRFLSKKILQLNMMHDRGYWLKPHLPLTLWCHVAKLSVSSYFLFALLNHNKSLIYLLGEKQRMRTSNEEKNRDFKRIDNGIEESINYWQIPRCRHSKQSAISLVVVLMNNFV